MERVNVASILFHFHIIAIAAANIVLGENNAIFGPGTIDVAAQELFILIDEIQESFDSCSDEIDGV